MESSSTTIIIASISLLASVITASLSYVFTKRSQRLNDEKRIKEEFFRQFVKALSDVAIDNKDKNAQINLSESINTLLLIGSPGVVRALMKFHSHVSIENNKVDRNSIEWLNIHDHLLGELFKQLRLDLFGGNKVNAGFPDIRLVGRGKN